MFLGNLLLGRRFINLTVTEHLRRMIKLRFGASQIYCIADYPCRAIVQSKACDKWDARKKFFGQPYYETLVIVTSTSYTKDEPLEYLIKALEIVISTNPLIQIICVVTGKGLLKDEFKSQYAQSLAVKYPLHQIWAETQHDYMDLLSCCDLGLSFHRSTSGLDFPMKLIDMISVGIPTCSFEYEAMEDISKVHGIDLFKNANDLSRILLNAKVCHKNMRYDGIFWEDASKSIMINLMHF